MSRHAEDAIGLATAAEAAACLPLVCSTVDMTFGNRAQRTRNILNWLYVDEWSWLNHTCGAGLNFLATSPVALGRTPRPTAPVAQAWASSAGKLNVFTLQEVQVQVLGEVYVKYTSICIAHFTQTVSNALRHGSHSFTCKLHHACLYSPAAEHHRPLAGTHFTVPRRVEGWVDLGGWLHTEIECRFGSRTRRVTHPSTNRAQRRLTSLI